MNPGHLRQSSAPATRYLTWLIWILFAIAAAALVIDHRAHLFGVLPYLLLLACPLMHLFMHHGHRHRHREHGADSLRERREP